MNLFSEEFFPWKNIVGIQTICYNHLRSRPISKTSRRTQITLLETQKYQTKIEVAKVIVLMTFYEEIKGCYEMVNGFLVSRTSNLYDGKHLI